jgi:hypothetical protein
VSFGVSYATVAFPVTPSTRIVTVMCRFGPDNER